MSLTRRELDEILSRGRIFCDLWVVAYFLGLSWNTVDHMYRLGKFPKVLALDGSEWRPSGERLVVVEKFAEMVSVERRSEFELWRKGRFEIAPFGTRKPAPLLDHTTLESVMPTGLVTASR